MHILFLPEAQNPVEPLQHVAFWDISMKAWSVSLLCHSIPSAP